MRGVRAWTAALTILEGSMVVLCVVVDAKEKRKENRSASTKIGSGRSECGVEIERLGVRWVIETLSFGSLANATSQVGELQL